jgi:hypothetical protein
VSGPDVESITVEVGETVAKLIVSGLDIVKDGRGRTVVGITVTVD